MLHVYYIQLILMSDGECKNVPSTPGPSVAFDSISSSLLCLLPSVLLVGNLDTSSIVK